MSTIKVRLRKIKLLKSLLLKPHYVTIYVINGTTLEICELVVLCTYTAESKEETNLSTSRLGLRLPLTLVVCGMRRFSPRIDWVWVSLHSTLRSLAFDLWITSSGTLSAVVLVDYIIAAVRSTRFGIPCCRFGRLSVAGLRRCRAIVSSFWITLLPLRLCLSLLDYAAALLSSSFAPLA